MDINPAIFLGVLVAAIGLSVLRANPGRSANQAFTLVSLVGFLWCGIVALQNESSDPRPWMRANAIISLFVPWGIVLLQLSLVHPTQNHKQLFIRSLPWLFAVCIIIPLCFLESFIGATDATGRFRRGIAYGVHCAALGLMYISVISLASRQLQHLSGIRRLESQFVVISLGIGCVLCLGFLMIGNFLDNVIIKYTGIFITLLTYAIIGWSIAVRRIYNIRQTYVTILRYAFLMTAFVLLTLLIVRVLTYTFMSPVSLVIGASLGGVSTLIFEHQIRRRIERRKLTNLADIRISIIEEAKSEPSTERLTIRFSEIFKKSFHASSATLLFSTEGTYEAGTIKLSKSRAAFGAICSMGAVTPEALQRRPANISTEDLARFLAECSLGLAIVVPRGSPAPSFIVALGVKTNEWPFTYPEIEQIQNVTELMDSILAHSRLTAQAALRARMEHLAWMSRGLAHDLKNLITPVSSFLLHTEGRFPADSSEAEVHAQAQQSMHVMADYVRESLFFSERKEPFLESIGVAELCREVAEFMTTRATSREIKFVASCSSEAAIMADRVLLHRLLINLANNALDASAVGQTVSLTADADCKRVRFQISDQGSGIAPEHIARIFEPYFTTKNFGNNVRGWGLGLAICQTIALLHEGQISVESPADKGTIFTVDLPLRRDRPSATEKPIS